MISFSRFATVVVLAGALVSGCASIIKGTTQTVSINSNVRGGTVIVNGKQVGTTPYNGPIERKSGTTVTVSKEGYITKTITLTTEIESVFWGNIIIGGVVGSTTDLATGAMYYYAPATLQIDLDLDSSAPSAAPAAAPAPKANPKNAN